MYNFNKESEQDVYVSKKAYTESAGYQRLTLSRDRKYMALTTLSETLIVEGLK